MAIEEIIARLEALIGPDREVDALIVAHLNNAMVKPYPPTDDFGPKCRWQFWSLDGAHFLGNESKFPVAPVTASLDAAIALVDRLLKISVGKRYPSGTWSYSLFRKFGDAGCDAELFQSGTSVRISASAQTPALAICLALCRALQSQEPRP